MSNVWTKNTAISRRRFLSGSTIAGSAVHIGLPPLVAMFTANGTAWAAAKAPVETRFVLWFNGNGIVEKYWIPTETGKNYQLTPCLEPLAPFKDDMHVITGLDNPAARMVGPGNDHHRSMSALMTGTQFTGRGAGGASIDQAIARRYASQTRIPSLVLSSQGGVGTKSRSTTISFDAQGRAIPAESVPRRIFERLFEPPAHRRNEGRFQPSAHRFAMVQRRSGRPRASTRAALAMASRRARPAEPRA